MKKKHAQTPETTMSKRPRKSHITPAWWPNVVAAMRDAAVKVDTRGLMPLDQARALVQATEVYRKGEGEMLGGTYVLESDRVWAAILSLENEDEFLHEALRIKWEFHVRGFDNLALYERYGAAILPWLEAALDADGRFINVPWCRLPCLLAVDTEAAFMVAYKIRTVYNAPPGNMAVTAENWSTAPVLKDWLNRHPETGFRSLIALVRNGETRAEAFLRQFTSEDPAGVFANVSKALGASEAKQLFTALDLPQQLENAQVRAILNSSGTIAVPSGPLVSLSQLDIAFEDFECPLWDNANYFCSAMRVTGYVHPQGDAIVFQSLVTGLGMGNIRIEFHGYGPWFGEQQSRWAQDEEVIPRDALVEFIGDDTILDKITGVRTRYKDGKTQFRLPEKGGGETFTFMSPRSGQEITVSIAPIKELRKMVGPTGAVMIVLGGLKYRAGIFLDNDQLTKHMGMPEDTYPLFMFEDWSHPQAGQPASGSQDLMAMIEALRLRKRITRLLTGTTSVKHLMARFDLLGGWENDPTYWGVEKWSEPFKLYCWCPACTTEIYKAAPLCMNCGYKLK